MTSKRDGLLKIAAAEHAKMIEAGKKEEELSGHLEHHARALTVGLQPAQAFTMGWLFVNAVSDCLLKNSPAAREEPTLTENSPPVAPPEEPAAPRTVEEVLAALQENDTTLKETMDVLVGLLIGAQHDADEDPNPHIEKYQALRRQEEELVKEAAALGITAPAPS
jgi:hypothetical protein